MVLSRADSYLKGRTMIELQIPTWPLLFCAGNIVGVTLCFFAGWWLNRRTRNQMLDELSKIAVEFETPQEGENDAEDHHPGN